MLGEMRDELGLVRGEVRNTNERINQLEGYLSLNATGRGDTGVNKTQEMSRIAARLLLSSEKRPITVKTALPTLLLVCLQDP